MNIRENIITLSFLDNTYEYVLLSKDISESCYTYYLFDKFKILRTKRNSKKEEFRRRRAEHLRLSRQKIIIGDYYSSDYKNNNGKRILVTVAFNNPKVIEYQIKLIKKYIKGDFIHIICDNSNRIDSAQGIRNVCIQNEVTYIRVNSDIKPHGYSDSHGVALNWIWENILSKKEKDFALLDHDIFPIQEQNIEDYFDIENFWGSIRNKNGRWYLWPGFAFYRFDAVKNKKLNFRRYKHFGFIKAKNADTGSANWNCLYSKYNVIFIRNCDVASVDLSTNSIPLSNKDNNYVFENCIEYFNNKTWLHSINGSVWHDDNGKIELVYKCLDEKLLN